MDILLYFGGPALIAFLIQFLVGCRTQHKILRYIPIYCFVITLAFGVVPCKCSRKIPQNLLN